jgi:DNA-damage-inducible protein J
MVSHGCDTLYLSEALPFMATTMVHIRVEEKVKEQAAKTLAAMGMSVSDAVRILLVRVAAEKALPFEIKVPNTATRKAMEAADRGQGKRYKSVHALFKDLGSKQGRRIPSHEQG